MRFRMSPGGEELNGRSYTQIVQAMADMKMEKVTSLARYRKRTASRVAELHGFDIDASSDEGFVKSLAACGLLEKV